MVIVGASVYPYPELIISILVISPETTLAIPVAVIPLGGLEKVTVGIVT